MSLAMVFAQAWGVFQLAMIGSLARTVRLRTLMLALLAGVYACTAVVIPLQLLCVHVISALTGMPVHEAIGVGTYTVGPPIEEILKLAPLLLILRLPAPRRQWTITDHLLIAAAVGSGVGLAEAFFSADKPEHATVAQAGWMLSTNISLPFVPSIVTSLTSWLPPAVASDDVRLGIERAHPWINIHLVWSAMGGFAVALWRLERHLVAKVAALALLVYIIADHMIWNAQLHLAVSKALDLPQRGFLLYVPLAMLAVAWLLDRRRWSHGSSWPLLACESGDSVRVRGLARGLPSLLSTGPFAVLEFLRLRRAAATAIATAHHHTSGDEVDHSLESAVLRRRGQLDAPRTAINAIQRPTRTRVRPPKSIARQVITYVVWILMLLPPFVWFVVAGGPNTAWMRAYLRTPAGSWVIALATASGMIWTVRRGIAGLRLRRALATLPEGDLAAAMALRTLASWGTVLFGGYTLTRMLAVSPTSSLIPTVNQSENASVASTDGSALMCVAPAATDPPEIEPEHERHTTALQSWMELPVFAGTPDDPGWLQVHEGDSSGMKALRALGWLALMPVWAPGAIIANGVDELNPTHFSPLHLQIVEPTVELYSGQIADPLMESDPPSIPLEQHGRWLYNPETGEWMML